MKKLLLLVLSLALCFGLTGCIERLPGVHLELEVIGVNSVPGAGYFRRNEALPLATDAYGRQLFAFITRYEGENLISLIVSQQTTEKHACYYDNINYICRFAEERIQSGRLDTDLVYSMFSGEEITQLKSQNDWGEPLEKERFFEVEVTPVKFLPIANEEKEGALGKLGYRTESTSIKLLSIDKNGKSIFFIRAAVDGETKYKRLLAVFDWWGNFLGEDAVVELNNPPDFQEDIVRLKEAVGWCSFPFAKK